MSDTCQVCGCQIWYDKEYNCWVDNSGGDVCGHYGDNSPHEPLLEVVTNENATS